MTLCCHYRRKNKNLQSANPPKQRWLWCLRPSQIPLHAKRVKGKRKHYSTVPSLGSQLFRCDLDRPEEGTEEEGLMSGHWNTGWLKLAGRVFSGNSWDRNSPFEDFIFCPNSTSYFKQMTFHIILLLANRHCPVPCWGPPCCSAVSPPHTPPTSRWLEEKDHFQSVHLKLFDFRINNLSAKIIDPLKRLLTPHSHTLFHHMICSPFEALGRAAACCSTYLWQRRTRAHMLPRRSKAAP